MKLAMALAAGVLLVAATGCHGLGGSASKRAPQSGGASTPDWLPAFAALGSAGGGEEGEAPSGGGGFAGGFGGGGGGDSTSSTDEGAEGADGDHSSATEAAAGSAAGAPGQGSAAEGFGLDAYSGGGEE